MSTRAAKLPDAPFPSLFLRTRWLGQVLRVRKEEKKPQPTFLKEGSSVCTTTTGCRPFSYLYFFRYTMSRAFYHPCPRQHRTQSSPIIHPPCIQKADSFCNSDTIITRFRESSRSNWVTSQPRTRPPPLMFSSTSVSLSFLSRCRRRWLA